MIRIGPAGWAYRDWEGVVYPKPKPRGFDPLTYLSRYFDVVEVNSTFYRPATAAVAETWADRVAGNAEFRFTAKLWRRFTHERGSAWAAAEVREARAGMDPLMEAGRLGAVLLQFPWSFRNDAAGREWLGDLATTFEDLPLVVEVRHESWNDAAFYSELRERGIGFVNIDQPQFRDSIAPSARTTAAVGYIRVHGRNYQDWWRRDQEPYQRYNYLYDAGEMREWAERAREVDAAAEVRDVYVVTNNHYRGKAAANALMLRGMIEARRVPGPPSLFAEYGDVLRGYAEPGDAPPQPSLF